MQQRLTRLVQTKLYQTQYLNTIDSPCIALVMKMYELPADTDSNSAVS
jgi:hypothetical protein